MARPCPKTPNPTSPYSNVLSRVSPTFWPSINRRIRPRSHSTESLCVFSRDASAVFHSTSGERPLQFPFTSSATVAFLLPEVSLDEARAIGERLRMSLEQIDSFYSPLGALPGVTVSLGVAEMHLQESLQGLLRRADEALYRAKQHGRNRLCG